MESIQSACERRDWIGKERTHVVEFAAPVVRSIVDCDISWSAEERERFEILPSPIHGLGLFPKYYIPKGAYVISYVGDHISPTKAALRDAMYRYNHIDVYMFQLDDVTGEVMDATFRGSSAKYVNHSCSPNLRAEVSAHYTRDDRREVFLEKSSCGSSLRATLKWARS